MSESQASWPDEWGVGAPRPDPDLGCLGPAAATKGGRPVGEGGALRKWDREFPHMEDFHWWKMENGEFMLNLRAPDPCPGVAESPRPESPSQVCVGTEDPVLSLGCLNLGRLAGAWNRACVYNTDC